MPAQCACGLLFPSVSNQPRTLPELLCGARLVVRHRLARQQQGPEDQANRAIYRGESNCGGSRGPWHPARAHGPLFPFQRRRGHGDERWRAPGPQPSRAHGWLEYGRLPRHLRQESPALREHGRGGLFGQGLHERLPHPARHGGGGDPGKVPQGNWCLRRVRGLPRLHRIEPRQARRSGARVLRRCGGFGQARGFVDDDAGGGRGVSYRDRSEPRTVRQGAVLLAGVPPVGRRTSRRCRQGSRDADRDR
mmetsp:Transcript_13079/g.39534  ORF Transcript_13079/g.39534 Transcript_13079/m.39534 type:complete len:249 (+) Transcript_13079:1106-1852(+)